MPERTFVPQACSTQNVIVSAYTYQDKVPSSIPIAIGTKFQFIRINEPNWVYSKYWVFNSMVNSIQA